MFIFAASAMHSVQQDTVTIQSLHGNLVPGRILHFLYGGRVIEKQAGNKVFTIWKMYRYRKGLQQLWQKPEIVRIQSLWEKVAEANPSYIFEESEDDKVAGVTNWFDNVDLSVVRPMEFKEGYFFI